MIYKTNEELRNSWINSGAGFILVYSISSRASFVQALSICQQVRNIKETGTSLLSEFGPTTSLESSSALVPIVLAGSHCEKSTGREVSVQEGYDLAQTLGCHFFEVSTKDRTCVQNAFYDIIRLLQRQRGLVLQKETVAYKKNSTRLKPKKPKSLIGQCLKPFVSWARVRYRKKLLRQAPRRNRHTV